MNTVEMIEKPRVLIIDDDHAFGEGVMEYLSLEGYDTELCTEPEEALIKITGTFFDAIILDLILPRINGYRLFKYIREQVDTPILMLTAKKSDLDEVLGLEIGSDDYLKKPCNMKVLATRLKKAIQQSKKGIKTVTNPILKVGNLVMDIEKRTVSVLTTPLKITNTEFKILEFLIRNKGRSCSKESIIEYSLGRKPYTKESSLDVHISKIRQKLKNSEHAKAFINTDYGYGYTLDEIN